MTIESMKKRLDIYERENRELKTQIGQFYSDMYGASGFAERNIDLERANAELQDALDDQADEIAKLVEINNRRKKHLNELYQTYGFLKKIIPEVTPSPPLRKTRTS